MRYRGLRDTRQTQAGFFVHLVLFSQYMALVALVLAAVALKVLSR